MKTSVISNLEGTLSRIEMKNIMAGNEDPGEEDGNICAEWAVDCVCLDGTSHGCQTSSMCGYLCSL